MARKLNKEKIVRKAATLASKTVDAMESVANKTEAAADSAKEKFEDMMNKPEVVEAKEDISEAAETTAKAVKTAVKAIRTKVSDVVLQVSEDVTISDIEKAVKKDAADKNLKGDIKIYLNVGEEAAYYTVNGEGDESMRVDFAEI